MFPYGLKLASDWQRVPVSDLEPLLPSSVEKINRAVYGRSHPSVAAGQADRDHLDKWDTYSTIVDPATGTRYLLDAEGMQKNKGFTDGNLRQKIYYGLGSFFGRNKDFYKQLAKQHGTEVATPPSEKIKNFTKSVVAPAAALGVTGLGLLKGPGLLKKLNPFHKEPPTFAEQVSKGVSGFLQHPGGIPALAAMGVGGLGLGYLGVNSLLDAGRNRNRRRRREEAKQRFENALRREQETKLSSAVEDFITACEERLEKKEAGFTNAAIGTISLAGLAALALGAVNGYQSEPGSVRRYKELRRIREEQLAKRLEQERQFHAGDIGGGLTGDNHMKKLSSLDFSTGCAPILAQLGIPFRVKTASGGGGGGGQS